MSDNKNLLELTLSEVATMANLILVQNSWIEKALPFIEVEIEFLETFLEMNEEDVSDYKILKELYRIAIEDLGIKKDD